MSVKPIPFFTVVGNLRNTLLEGNFLRSSSVLNKKSNNTRQEVKLANVILLFGNKNDQIPFDSILAENGSPLLTESNQFITNE